jgi:putative membrane protein
MHKLGIHYQNFTYTWSGVRINWASFIINFGFSVIVVVFYCVMAEYIPRIKLWQGVAYGLGIWVVFHLIVMPFMGLTPSTFHLPLDENLSEAFGHIVWLWSAEVVRRDLRSRITHGPDAMTVPRVLATP